MSPPNRLTTDTEEAWLSIKKIVVFIRRSIPPLLGGATFILLVPILHFWLNDEINFNEQRITYENISKFLEVSLDNIGDMAIIFGIFIFLKNIKANKESRHLDLQKIIEDSQENRASFTRYKALEKLNSDGISLRRVDLRNADLKEINLKGANLIGSNLMEADLSYSKLIGADISNSILINTKLCGADLKNAKLIRSLMIGSDLVECKNLTYKQIEGAIESPIMCGVRLPAEVAGLPKDKSLDDLRNRDCEIAKTILIDQHNYTSEEADDLIKSAREKEWVSYTTIFNHLTEE